MIIGAGAAGRIIIRELKSSREICARPVCVIDDNPNKKGRLIEGIRIVGNREVILEAVKKYQVDLILFAIPTVTPERKRDVLNICKETRCELKSLPGLYQVANGDVSMSKMRPVEVEDLLGRVAIHVNLEEISSYLNDQVVLVTGGWSIIGTTKKNDLFSTVVMA